MTDTVLIVGAGPTGLALALWLSKFNVPVRIIDKSSGPGQTSRAMVVHARILEFYQQIGLADELVARGAIINTISIYKNGSRIASVPVGLIGQNISPFPFVLAFPQDAHEKLLIENLTLAGIEVERHTELVSYVEKDNVVHATVNKQGHSEIIQTPYLIGCDGAHSKVRELANIKFPGGTYSQIFYVADVKASGNLPHDSLQACLGDGDFTLAFPIKADDNTRLIGIVPAKDEKKSDIRFTDVQASATHNTRLSVSAVNWFSTYHSHHRVAERFHVGRIFLLGDAGHIHSPAGGQGMNTGIGDAVNLAWKLAAVMQNRASARMLDTYETERIAFAKRLIATTDSAFKAIINKSITGKFVRAVLIPYLFPLLTKFDFFKRFVFMTISQTAIQYRHSPLSQGTAGNIKGGDRLPWVKTVDNYKPLQALNWQVHVYGVASDVFKQTIATLGLQLHEFIWNADVGKSALIKDAAYLIRPDGYIALIEAQQNAKRITSFLREFGIRV